MNINGKELRVRMSVFSSSSPFEDGRCVCEVEFGEFGEASDFIAANPNPKWVFDRGSEVFLLFEIAEEGKEWVLAFWQQGWERPERARFKRAVDSYAFLDSTGALEMRIDGTDCAFSVLVEGGDGTLLMNKTFGGFSSYNKWLGEEGGDLPDEGFDAYYGIVEKAGDTVSAFPVCSLGEDMFYRGNVKRFIDLGTASEIVSLYREHRMQRDAQAEKWVESLRSSDEYYPDAIDGYSASFDENAEYLRKALTNLDVRGYKVVGVEWANCAVPGHFDGEYEYAVVRFGDRRIFKANAFADTEKVAGAICSQVNRCIIYPFCSGEEFERLTESLPMDDSF